MKLYLLLVLPGTEEFPAKTCYSIWKRQGVNWVQPCDFSQESILAFSHRACTLAGKEEKCVCAIWCDGSIMEADCKAPAAGSRAGICPVNWRTQVI